MSKSKTLTAEQKSYDKWNFRISAVGLLVQILGFILVIWTIHESTRVFQRTVYANAVQWIIELDKEFLARPELLPYFYDDIPVVPGDAHYNQALLMAEYVLDSMDTFLEHRITSVGEPIHDTWFEWMHDMFSTSPVLRQYMQDHKAWYYDGPLYRKVYLKWECKYSGKPPEECEKIGKE